MMSSSAPARSNTTTSKVPLMLQQPTPPSEYHKPLQSPPLKRKRVSKACDFCNRRGRKCRMPDGVGNANLGAVQNGNAAKDGGNSSNNNSNGNASSPESQDHQHKPTIQCLTCIEYGVQCTWNRTAAKRGIKPKNQQPRHGDIEGRWKLDESRHGSKALLEVLIEVFFNDVYPIVCTVMEEPFMRRWHSEQMPNSKSSYARFMALCALSSQRITAGASDAPPEVVKALRPRFYLDEAVAAIPKDIEEDANFETLQAIHLVCVMTVEIGEARQFHGMLGLYHTIVSEQGLTDERRWPSNISPTEREERRRLFWHFYRLEVHTSLILGHTICCSELQAAVAYPSIPDADSSDPLEGTEWLTGWNYVTDLYRGLEHLIICFRAQRMANPTRPPSLPTATLLDWPARKRLFDHLTAQYTTLPPRFRHAAEMSPDARRNRCGYQVANIICEYRLVQIMTVAAEPDEGAFYEACRTTMSLVEEISAIPVDFLKAMSLAMIQEVSGFGHILSSFIGKQLSHTDYLHLRQVLLCIAELLDGLSSCIPAAAQDSSRLKVYVEEIDTYIGKDHLQQHHHVQNLQPTQQVPQQVPQHQQRPHLPQLPQPPQPPQPQHISSVHAVTHPPHPQTHVQAQAMHNQNIPDHVAPGMHEPHDEALKQDDMAHMYVPFEFLERIPWPREWLLEPNYANT